MNNDNVPVLDFLENAYAGARMVDDDDMAVRIARAIAAFKSDPKMIVFTDEFCRWYFELNFGTPGNESEEEPNGRNPEVS